MMWKKPGSLTIIWFHKKCQSFDPTTIFLFSTPLMRTFFFYPGSILWPTIILPLMTLLSVSLFSLDLAKLPPKLNPTLFLFCTCTHTSEQDWRQVSNHTDLSHLTINFKLAILLLGNYIKLLCILIPLIFSLYYVDLSHLVLSPRIPPALNSCNDFPTSLRKVEQSIEDFFRYSLHYHLPAAALTYSTFPPIIVYKLSLPLFKASPFTCALDIIPSWTTYIKSFQ